MKRGPHSPYRTFSTDEWAELRRRMPLSVSESELQRLRGVNERVSLEEVARVYLPISRLLSLHASSVRTLDRGVREFMGVEPDKVPFIVGIAGSVAVGKSTVARLLRTLLARWPENPKVDLVTTDGFLRPTAELERRGLMHRKGFPESFDRDRLLLFLEDVKSGRRHVEAPVYSHRLYDIVPGEFVVVDRPDILIVEGLNVLQAGSSEQGTEQVFVSDYFDFSLYIDARTEHIAEWYVNRFMTLRETVFSQPGSYFGHYADLDDEEARKTAIGIWESINRVNLIENILPTRGRAKLVLRKGRDHSIDQVRLRKL